jgi:hypothetical protein
MRAGRLRLVALLLLEHLKQSHQIGWALLLLAQEHQEHHHELLLLLLHHHEHHHHGGVHASPAGIAHHAGHPHSRAHAGKAEHLRHQIGARCATTHVQVGQRRQGWEGTALAHSLDVGAALAVIGCVSCHLVSRHRLHRHHSGRQGLLHRSHALALSLAHLGRDHDQLGAETGNRVAHGGVSFKRCLRCLSPRPDDK